MGQWKNRNLHNVKNESKRLLSYHWAKTPSADKISKHLKVHTFVTKCDVYMAVSFREFKENQMTHITTKTKLTMRKLASTRDKLSSEFLENLMFFR